MRQGAASRAGGDRSRQLGPAARRAKGPGRCSGKGARLLALVGHPVGVDGPARLVEILEQSRQLIGPRGRLCPPVPLCAWQAQVPRGARSCLGDSAKGGLVATSRVLPSCAALLTVCRVVLWVYPYRGARGREGTQIRGKREARQTILCHRRQ